MKDHYDESTREHKGITITLRWHYDHCMGEPWKENDGHGIVSGWESRDKAPGELVLNSDRGSKRFYDYAETLKVARRDGWGISEEEKAKLEAPKRVVASREYHVENGIRQDRLTWQEIPGHKLTQREIAAASVMADFEHLKAWCNDEWHWCGYSVEIEGYDYNESLWGIESTDTDYHAKEAFADAVRWLERELSEEADAATRDIATV